MPSASHGEQVQTSSEFFLKSLKFFDMPLSNFRNRCACLKLFCNHRYFRMLLQEVRPEVPLAVVACIQMWNDTQSCG